MKVVSVKRQYLRTLILLAIFITYLFGGSALFHAIESRDEEEEINKTKVLEQMLQQRFNLSEEDIVFLAKTVRENLYMGKMDRKWNFTQALFFSTTVVTTIGYGVSAPSTKAGKGVCMVYALFGIPLTILLYQSVGDIINAFFAFLIRRVKRRTGNLARVRNLELGMLDGILIAVYFSVGAATFSILEGWLYLDSLYYCFITLSTIGFGDYVALQKHNDHMSHTAYLALWVTFIMLGLAVISSGLNLFIRFTMEMTTTDQSKKEIDKASLKMVKDISHDGTQTRQSSIKTNTTIVHDISENNSIGTPPLENKQEKKKLIHNCDHAEPLLNHTQCQNNTHQRNNDEDNNKNIIHANNNDGNAKRVRIANSDVVVMTEVTISSDSDHNNYYQQCHF